MPASAPAPASQAAADSGSSLAAVDERPESGGDTGRDAGRGHRARRAAEAAIFAASADSLEGVREADAAAGRLSSEDLDHANDDGSQGLSMKLSRYLLEPAARPPEHAALCRRCHSLKHHARLPDAAPAMQAGRSSSAEHDDDTRPLERAASICTAIAQDSTPQFDVFDQIRSEARSGRRCVVVHVVDVMDVPFGTADIARRLEELGPAAPRVVTVVNRIDLLFRQQRLAELARPRIATLLHASHSGNRGAIYADQGHARRTEARLVSALKGWGAEALANVVRTIASRGTSGAVYLVGCANAGKSSLIGAFLRRSGRSPSMGVSGDAEEARPVYKSLSTREMIDHGDQPEAVAATAPLVSHLPGTTLADVRLPTRAFGDLFGATSGRRHSDEDAEVVDLPGILTPGMADYIDPSKLADALPRKHLANKPMAIGRGKSLILGGIVRLDYLDGDADHILVSNFTALEAHATSRPEHILATDRGVRAMDVPDMAVALETTLTKTASGQHTRGNQSTRTRDRRGIAPSMATTGINVADIVFKDLGFASVGVWRGSATVRVWTPDGRHVVQRPPLFFDPYAQR